MILFICKNKNIHHPNVYVCSVSFFTRLLCYGLNKVWKFLFFIKNFIIIIIIITSSIGIIIVINLFGNT